MLCVDALMISDELKKTVGWAALEYILPGSVVGVGTGSTVSYFIEALATIRYKIHGVVSSSNVSSVKLKDLGIPLFDLNDVDCVDVYIDGADEIDSNMQMIKGGGGALTKEKVIAAVAQKFICIIDSSKYVDILGKRPVPVEVIPMARSWVAREIVRLGGSPKYRLGMITDNYNNIIDVYNLKIFNAVNLEEQMNNIPGVVTVGIFARRVANIVLIGTEQGIEVLG